MNEKGRSKATNCHGYEGPRRHLLERLPYYSSHRYLLSFGVNAIPAFIARKHRDVLVSIGSGKVPQTIGPVHRCLWHEGNLRENDPREAP